MTTTKKGAKRKTLPVQGIPRLADLLKHLKIDQWDTLIVGDGSGTGWKQGAGWAAVLIDRATYARRLFYGAMNTGTVMLGELFPYLYALSWYMCKDGPGRQRQREIAKLKRRLQVHIITDNQTIATAGNHPQSRRAYPELWKGFDSFTARGLTLTFHYVERDRVTLNVLVDEVSRQARLSVEDAFERAIQKLAKKYPGLPEDVTIYDFSH